MHAPGSTLSPLSHRLFLTLWLASLAGYFGNAIQSVGAAWLMTALDGRADRVALVQTAIQHQQSEFASFEDARRKFEREYLAQILRITEGNVTQAARLAKRNRTEFYKLLQRHQLDPKLFKEARKQQQT